MLSEEQLRSGRKHGEIRGEPLSLLSITSRFYYKKTPTKCTLRVMCALQSVSPACAFCWSLQIGKFAGNLSLYCLSLQGFITRRLQQNAHFGSCARSKASARRVHFVGVFRSGNSRGTSLSIVYHFKVLLQEDSNKMHTSGHVRAPKRQPGVCILLES